MRSGTVRLVCVCLLALLICTDAAKKRGKSSSNNRNDAKRPKLRHNVAPAHPDTFQHAGEVVIRAASEQDARDLAARHNYTFEGEVRGLLDDLERHYLLRLHGDEAHHQHTEERTALQRSHETHATLLQEAQWGQPQVRRWHHTRDRAHRDADVDPGDPLYQDQWHLHDGGFRHVHANVRDAWLQGYTGLGVTVAVVDDGLQHTHADLRRNYDASLGTNYNGQPGAVNDPAPGPDDWHGTSVAGVVAASRNDATCGTGVAPEAKLAGIRLIADAVADYQEAQALSRTPDRISVYSNSWGPMDDGRHLGRPGYLTRETLRSMSHRGRGGRGSVYVWAAGNGRVQQDRCDYDGYANSRYTIAVAAVGADGRVAYYSEPCAALLVSAPSSGAPGRGIVTTDRLGPEGYSDGDCTTTFGGTSAAAPLVAGVVALVLEANPRLGWLDVQHVLLRSAKRVDDASSSWMRNGGGLYYSHDYGFGLVDAGAAVQLASGWTNVVPTPHPHLGARNALNVRIPDDGSMNQYSEHVSESFHVEHVEVEVDIAHAHRGELRIRLTSPAGTEVQFAELHGDRHADYSHWTFTSTAFWSEGSQGEWKLQVRDRIRGTQGTLHYWKLQVYGYV